VGLERDKGMEGTMVWRGHGFGKGQGYERDMAMEGTWVWKGHGYGRDMDIEGT